MRTAVIGTIIGLVVAIIAVTSSCSITHKSEEYACTKNTDCEDDARICTDGFCVLPGGVIVDAPRGDGPRGDSNNCPAPCTSCNTALKTCTVNCALTSCTNNITCPSGYKCDINCSTENSCRNGISCQIGASCDIECSGKSSCEGIQCGPGPCSVGCSGPGACRQISCGNSCACDVTCTGTQSCSQNINCSSLACRSGSGCTSAPAFCHSCL